MFALWRAAKAHAKLGMAGSNEQATVTSGEWGPRQVLSRSVGSHRAVIIENAGIALVGALIGSWLLRQWGFEFGTGEVIGFPIRAFIGAIVLFLMAKLVASKRAADLGPSPGAQQ